MTGGNKLLIYKIIPDRPKNNPLAEFNHLPADIQFLKRYTQKQNDVEVKIALGGGKIKELFKKRGWNFKSGYINGTKCR